MSKANVDTASADECGDCAGRTATVSNSDRVAILAAGGESSRDDKRWLSRMVIDT